MKFIMKRVRAAEHRPARGSVDQRTNGANMLQLMHRISSRSLPHKQLLD